MGAPKKQAALQDRSRCITGGEQVESDGTARHCRALHEQDVTPGQADEIDQLYDQLLSAEKTILGEYPKPP